MDDQDWSNLQKLVGDGPQTDLPASTERPALSRDAHGRFLPGSPGRPPGARNRISWRIWLAMLRHYEEHEAEILSRLMNLSHFPIYMRLVGRMLPQDPLEDELDLSTMSPEISNRRPAPCATRSNSPGNALLKKLRRTVARGRG